MRFGDSALAPQEHAMAVGWKNQARLLKDPPGLLEAWHASRSTYGRTVPKHSYRVSPPSSLLGTLVHLLPQIPMEGEMDKSRKPVLALANSNNRHRASPLFLTQEANEFLDYVLGFCV